MLIVDSGALWSLLQLLRKCHEAIRSEGSRLGDGDGDGDGDDEVKERTIFIRERASCKEAIASLLQNIGHYELRQVIYGEL